MLSLSHIPFGSLSNIFFPIESQARGCDWAAVNTTTSTSLWEEVGPPDTAKTAFSQGMLRSEQEHQPLPSSWLRSCIYIFVYIQYIYRHICVYSIYIYIYVYVCMYMYVLPYIPYSTHWHPHCWLINADQSPWLFNSLHFSKMFYNNPRAKLVEWLKNVIMMVTK